MLACASRTSAAVENCWRTPPIALEVAPEAIPPRSASTTSRAPSVASWNATEAPTAPAPATTIRTVLRSSPAGAWRGKGGTGRFPRSNSSAEPRRAREKKGFRGGKLVSPTRRRRRRLPLRRFEPLVELPLLPVVQPPQRRADVFAHRHPAPAEHVLRRRLERV